jgi:hypothetical protein
MKKEHLVLEIKYRDEKPYNLNNMINIEQREKLSLKSSINISESKNDFLIKTIDDINPTNRILCRRTYCDNNSVSSLTLIFCSVIISCAIYFT